MTDNDSIIAKLREELHEVIPAAPENLRLACGHSVPHAVGQAIYNYYDGREGVIVGLADRPEPDTSGLLPNAEAWWVDTTVGLLDGSRMACLDCAKRKGM